MAKDPISELSGVNKELKATNRELTLLESALRRVTGLAGSAFRSVTGAFGAATGRGTSMMLGTQNAQITTAAAAGGSAMPWAYSRTGSATIGGLQLGLGLAGAAYQAMPGLSTVMPRAMGFYQATTMMPGMTRQALTASSFTNMRGGITGPNEDIAATNILVNSFGMMSAGNLAKTQQEVRGAALGLGMANATAAQAIGSMHTGDFSGSLYQYGISTLDVKTGEVRSSADIARQIYQRVMGNRKLTPQQLEFSMREGTLNRFLNDTTDAAQQAVLRPLIQQIALGQNPDLRTMTGQNNPATNTLYAQTTSDMSLANRATDPMLQGYATTTQYLVQLNTALEGLPDQFFQLKGALDALGMSKTGNAIQTAVASAVGAAGTLATGAAVRSVFRKMAASSAAKTAAQAGSQGAEQAAVQTAGKVATRVGLSAAGKAVPIIGGVIAAETGQGLLASVATSAAVGGIFGSVPGALAAAGLTALGYLGTKALKAMASTSASALTAGENASGLGTGGLSLPANADPNLVQTLMSAGFTGQSLVTAYGIAKAESGGRSNAYNSKGLDKSYGLFQINMENNDPRNLNMGVKRNAAYLKKYGKLGYKGPESLLDPNINAKVAYDLYKDQGFNPWATYKSGAYLNKLDNTGSSGSQTVNINLKIDKATETEAVAFAKKVKDILMKDKDLSKMGSS